MHAVEKPQTIFHSICRMINEIGTLRALPNGESLFVGSSSGVFFINTVRRAISHTAATASHRAPNVDGDTPLASLPSPEECIYGPESHNETASSGLAGTPPDSDSVGVLPSHVIAKELLITYFRNWHPLFPFLHGPSCLEELEALYSGEADCPPRRPASLSMQIILQCLFNIAKLDRPDLPPLGRSRIRSEEHLLAALSMLSLRRDLASIQALLAAQLYFVATMCLQAASTTGGLLLRSIFKSGLHRCPFRYSAFSANDRDMRKRVFWSAYTLDRYTSQSLGHPLGIQDSDIDVCLPGKLELHRPVLQINRSDEGTSPEESILHLPTNHPQRQNTSGQSCVDSPQILAQDQSEHELGEGESIELRANQSTEAESISQRRQQNQSVQAQFVRYSVLVGRMIEMFHKSIHVRSASRQNILFLKADIDAWGNDMPYTTIARAVPDNSNIDPGVKSGGLNQGVFFGVAQQQLLLLVNRPSLSLEPTSAEFRHAVQICIGAARSIIRTLEEHSNSQGTLFWPGFTSAVWMSGLVLAFACQLKLHSISNATCDISASLRILKVMTQRWNLAQNCHDVLSMLLDSIQNPEAPEAPFRFPAERGGAKNSHFRDQVPPRGQKRPREEYPPCMSLGNEYCRPRLSTSEFLQPTRVPSAMGAGEDGQSFVMTGINISQRSNLGHHTDRDHVENTNQTTASRMAMDPDYLSRQQETEHLNEMLLPLPSIQPMHHLRQAYTADSSAFTNSHFGEWSLPTCVTPGFDSTMVYDVFDGAMWGPLLEIVEPNR